MFGINSYRELCGLHFGGITLASLEVLIKCAHQGAKRANEVVKQIKAALEADEKRRAASEHVGFQSNCFDYHTENRLFIRLPNFKLNPNDDTKTGSEQPSNKPARITLLGKNSGMLMPAEELSSSDDEFMDNWIPDLDGDVGAHETSEPISTVKEAIKSEPTASDRMSDDSEEDDTVVMTSLHDN